MKNSIEIHSDCEEGLSLLRERERERELLKKSRKNVSGAKTKLLKCSSAVEKTGTKNRTGRMRNLSIDRLEKLPCKEFHVRKVPRDSVG